MTQEDKALERVAEIAEDYQIDIDDPLRHEIYTAIQQAIEPLLNLIRRSAPYLDHRCAYDITGNSPESDFCTCGVRKLRKEINNLFDPET